VETVLFFRSTEWSVCGVHGLIWKTSISDGISMHLKQLFFPKTASNLPKLTSISLVLFSFCYVHFRPFLPDG
jgi:hypothetical protein